MDARGLLSCLFEHTYTIRSDVCSSVRLSLKLVSTSMVAKRAFLNIGYSSFEIFIIRLDYSSFLFFFFESQLKLNQKINHSSTFFNNLKILSELPKFHSFLKVRFSTYSLKYLLSKSSFKMEKK